MSTACQSARVAAVYMPPPLALSQLSSHNSAKYVTSITMALRADECRPEIRFSSVYFPLS